MSRLASKRVEIRNYLHRQAEARRSKPTERRVYILPQALVERVLDYQLGQSLPSEVAAVRELLDLGLRRVGA